MNVAVIGGSKCSKKEAKVAEELGRLIAEQGWTLVCGGHFGIMEAACRGAKSAGGLTVGILPDFDDAKANKYLDVKIPTGLGYARNILVARSANYLVAVSGKYGTLSEIAFAFNENRKVYGLGTWNIKGVVKVKTPEAAVAKIRKEIKC